MIVNTVIRSPYTYIGLYGSMTDQVRIWFACRICLLLYIYIFVRFVGRNLDVHVSTPSNMKYFVPPSIRRWPNTNLPTLNLVREKYSYYFDSY